MSGFVRAFVAGILAVASLAGAAASHAAEIRVVGLAFIPSTIRLDATSTLRFELRNNGAGGQRLSVDYSLGIPPGLNVVGAPRLGDNCIASAVQVTASVGSGSVNLIGLTLLPSGTCTVDVTVFAAQTGTYTATEAGNGSSILSATLTVLLPAFAQVNVSQTSVPFPPQEVGIVSAAKVVTVTNSGEGMLDITGITASGDFSPTQCSPATSLPYGGTCTFSIVFTPTVTGAGYGSVQISSNAGTTSIDVSGEGVAPLPALSPSPLNSGTVMVNTTATASVTLTNSSAGTAALTIANIAVISGAFFSRSHNCPGLLGVDEWCTIVVTYAPTSTGEHSGQLKVESNTLANSRVLTLSGTAIVTAPSAPNIAGATAGNGQATIAFTTPANNGSAITGYTVTANPGGITATGTTSPITVGGLTNGTAYTFVVTASNAFGVSPPSASVSVTPVSVPGAPTISGATAGNGQATVSFTPPASNGGSPITSYTVTSNPGGITATGAASPITVPGLTNGTAYTFTVTATNGVGTGSPSASSNSVTPATVPGAPTAVSATAGNGQATVSFTPPASNGGSPITSYTVTSSPGGITAIGSASPIAVTGLANGMAYAFTVTATNAVGTGSPSAASNSVTLTVSATLTPAPASFGSVVVDSNATLHVTLISTGTSTLTLSSISLSGSIFFTQTSTCTGSHAPGATCVITLKYTPIATGNHTAQLSVSSNAAGSPHVVAVSGTGIAPGVSLTPTPVNFGNVPVGASASSTLNLTNTGTAPLSVISITASGISFTQANTCPSSLAPGASCQINVTFAPTASGPHNGELGVLTNAGASPVVAPLSGVGAVPAVSLSSTALAFGSQTVNTTSLTQSVPVTNTGTAPLGIIAVTIGGDFGFTGCATPLTLAPGASCTLAIYFFPTATGNLAGSVSLASNAPGSPHVIMLSGTGTPLPVPGIALAPSSASFGTILVGQSATQVLALSNPGTANLDISSMLIVEPQPAAMRAKAVSFSQTNDCPAALAPSSACNITVTYAPTVAGSHAGELHVVSNAVPSPLVAALSGSANAGTTPGLQLSASSLTFSVQFPNTTSAAQSVTLTSSGTAPLVITQVAVSGDFSFSFSGCGPSTLATGATCSFAITFRPLSEGPHSGAIVITSNAPGSPHALSLGGTGSPRLAPEISLSPSDFAFGPVRTQRSITLRNRLTNAGAAALEISQISSAGSFFTQSNDCPSSIAVGSFCDIAVTYAPTATGPHSGQLVIHSNALPSPHIAALSGTGITVPPPFLGVDGALDFGQQVTGVTVRRTLTLANTGGDPLVISQMTLIGPGAFGLEGACATIAPERSCDLTVTFTPMDLAAFTARLDIVSNHSGGVVQVSLTGIGTALPQPALELSVGALGFGSQGVGSSTASRSVRLTSVGAVAAQINSIASSLPDFIVDANQCPALLAPQQGCDIGVVFKPVASGARIGSLLVQSNAAPEGGLPHSVSLIGVGCRFFTMGGSRNPQRRCAP